MAPTSTSSPGVSSTTASPCNSHDGNYIAFASDRDDPLGSSYNIWTLDLRTGALKRMTNDPSENHMPTWSPDDKQIAYSSTRDGANAVWAGGCRDRCNQQSI